MEVNKKLKVKKAVKKMLASKLNYELIVFHALCETQKFVINGINADNHDFGSKCDENPETAEDYCCGNMQFTPCEPTQNVLDKYHIDEDDFKRIADDLQEKLSFGSCGWCS